MELFASNPHYHSYLEYGENGENWRKRWRKRRLWGWIYEEFSWLAALPYDLCSQNSPAQKKLSAPAFSSRFATLHEEKKQSPCGWKSEEKISEERWGEVFSQIHSMLTFKRNPRLISSICRFNMQSKSTMFSTTSSRAQKTPHQTIIP